MYFTTRVLLLLIGLVSARGYRFYQDKIPNGGHVPHPCKPNFIWRGVGHISVLGGGVRNPFGQDFEIAKEWTQALCLKDSDGDGMTNGEELGDPDCVWTPDTIFPARVVNITHPGVCGPWNDPKCVGKNGWVDCEGGEYNCPAVHEPEVKNVTLRFPPTSVPSSLTSYYCMNFDLPTDEDYHLIGTEPYIDNPNVMHHIVLFGCNDKAKIGGAPALCNMAAEGCTEMLGLWTLGMPGECLFKDIGYLFGKNGIKKAALQFHWTNPEARTDYIDSSGIKIHFTPKLRQFNAGLFETGELALEIPPGQDRFTQTSKCSSECTQSMLTDSIYLTTGLNHMHYLGYQMNVELFRNGQKVVDLAKDDVYSYDTPILHTYQTPIEVKPGDNLLTTCTFRSLSKTKTTYFGEGSFDEMCFGIFTAYPRENIKMPVCLTWKDYDICGQTQTCNSNNFFNSTTPDELALRTMVLEHCSAYGSCRAECPDAVRQAKEHPCLTGKNYAYHMYGLTQMKDKDMQSFYHAMKSCECNSREVRDIIDNTIELDVDSNALATRATTLLVFVSLLSAFF